MSKINKRKKRQKERLSQSGVSNMRESDIFRKILLYGWMGLILISPFIRAKTFLVFSAPKFFFSLTVLIILLSVALIGLVLGRLYLPKTRWFYPLIFYSSVFIVSTIFSIDRHASFWGAYPSFHTGLIAYLLCVFFFLIFLMSKPTIDEIKSFIKSFVAVGAIISIQAIFERYGVLNVGNEGAVGGQRAVGMLGNSDYTLSLLLFIAPLNFYLFLEYFKSKSKYIYLSIIPLNLFSIFLLTPVSMQKLILGLLLVGRGLPLILMLILLSFIYFLFLRKKIVIQEIDKKKLIISILMISFLSLMVLTILGKGKINAFLNTSANEQRFWAWRAGVEIGKNNLFSGSGPATVRYILPQIQKNHPMDVWVYSAKTDNLHNEIIDRFAKLGLFGLFGYVFLWGSIFYLIFKSIRLNPEKNLLITLGISLFLYFSFNQFFFSTVGTMFLSWLGLGMILIITERVEFSKIYLSKAIRNTIFCATIMGGIFLSFWSIRYWLADYYYGKASKNLAGYGYSEKATKLFPFRDVYWEQYGFNSYYYLMVYSPKFENKELIKENKEFVLANSKNAIERAIEIKPKRASNWLSYGSVLLGSKIVSPENEIRAEEAFEKALALELYPNPLSYLRIANAYEYVGDYDNEKKYLDRSDEILENQPKPYDYSTIKHKIVISYAELYKARGDSENALSKYKEAKKYLGPGIELDRLNEIIEKEEKSTELQ